MANIRIGYLNLWRGGTLIAKCCQHPQFPATDTQVDSKTFFWRTRYGIGSGNGVFVVTDSNKYIDFSEGGGELTATLTLGIYSGQTLATEIKTRLDAAGALTYTVTYSESTAKFTIAASGTFSLLWFTGTHKATDASDLLGYSDAADDTGVATYTADYRRIHWPRAYADINLGVAREANFISIIGHNISSAATIKLYGADDSAFTTNVVEDAVAHYAGDIFKFLSTARTKQYFRIEVQDPANSNSYIQIAGICLYKYFEPNRHFTLDYEDGKDGFTEVELSDSLNIYGQERPTLRAWRLPFEGLNDTAKAAVDALIKECDTFKAFVVCFDPDNPNTTSHLVHLTEISRPRFNYNNNWSWEMSIREFV